MTTILKTCFRRAWTADEVEQLRRDYPDHPAQLVADALGRSVRAVYGKAKGLGLEKSEAFKASDLSGRTQRGQMHPAMKATRFKPGQKPWNKGVKGSTGTQEACRATQFKPRSPEECPNYRPIGSLRLNRNSGGYIERKVSDDRSIAPARRWEAEHRLVWIAAHGPVPEGHIVVFKPGQHTLDPERITLDRLECISRSENLKRNSVHRYPPELRRLVQLRGALQRQINRKTRMAKEAEQA